VKLSIDRIRQLSLAYAQGDLNPPWRRPQGIDERWIKAYAEAWFVCGYQGRCTFALDDIVVTVLEH
jgi:hypothetical protein